MIIAGYHSYLFILVNENYYTTKDYHFKITKWKLNMEGSRKKNRYILGQIKTLYLSFLWKSTKKFISNKHKNLTLIDLIILSTTQERDKVMSKFCFKSLLCKEMFGTITCFGLGAQIPPPPAYFWFFFNSSLCGGL